MAESERKRRKKIDPEIKKSIIAYALQEYSAPTSRSVFDFLNYELASDGFLLTATLAAAIEKPVYGPPEVPKLRSFSELTFGSDEEFDSTFKLNRSTIRRLMIELKTLPSCKLEDDSNILKNLCCLLYFLANKEASVEEICKVFSINSKDDLIEELVNVSKKLVNIGNKVNLRWPLDSEALEIAERFVRKHKFPDVMGVLGNCIFGNASDGVLFQAVVDDQELYLDICATELCNGKPSPAEYFVSSPTYNFLTDFVPQDCNILAASIYPDKIPNLLTPFKDDGKLTQEEQSFNNMVVKCLSVLRTTMESHIMRFPRLENINLPPSEAKHLILGSSVLHNASNIFRDLAPF